MRLITPTLPGMGLEREGINQRNVASRPHWTQPQTCEPRHFLTPSTGRNNYLVSDTVRAQLEHPLFETKRASLQYGHPAMLFSLCCVRGRTERGKKDSRPATQSSPKYKAAAAMRITDHGHGRASYHGRPAPARPAMLLLQTTACRPGRNKSPGGPGARVTASATLEVDQRGLAGSSTRPNLLFFLREGTSAVRQQGLMNNSNRHSQTRGRLAVPGCGELNRVFLSTVGSGTRTTFPQHGK